MLLSHGEEFWSVALSGTARIDSDYNEGNLVNEA